jgi:hypothetical protein
MSSSRRITYIPDPQVRELIRNVMDERDRIQRELQETKEELRQLKLLRLAERVVASGQFEVRADGEVVLKNRSE